MIIKFIGYSAAFLTTFSFLPQTLKTIRDKDTKSISLLMYSMFTLGVLAWLIYGALTHDTPLLIANMITLFFAFIILWLKIKYK